MYVLTYHISYIISDHSTDLVPVLICYQEIAMIQRYI